MHTKDMITKEKAIQIAHDDAINVYRNLSDYETDIRLSNHKWYVDFILKNKEAQGGGAHYIISEESGDILQKRYEQ